MRILASNPDSIGDLVLRQPLFAALREAGHEVMLIVRSGWLPIMPAIAPGAEVLALPVDPYGDSMDWEALGGLVDRAISFRPDVFLVASYQWTPFEEGLAQRLPGVRKVGMTGKLFAGDPRSGVRNVSTLRLDLSAQVVESTLETSKNALLASTLLTHSVTLPRPKLALTEGQKRAGQLALPKYGLVPGGYWVACVGHHEYTKVRNWGTDRWGEALGYWARAYGRKFLLIGTEAEEAASREVAERIERDAPGAAVVAHGLDLDAMLGVIESSAGYVGRDTGPMHVAAACGRPVVAVFGGGTWPRFVPAVEPSRVMTMNVPCGGCHWVCHLPESVCVKGVPVERVRRAIDDMERGQIKGAEVDVIEPDGVQLARLIRESAEGYREMLERATRLEAKQGREEELAKRLVVVEERAAVATRLTEELRGRLYKEESAAADLRVKLSKSVSEQEVLEGTIRQMERTTAEQTAAAWKAAKGAKQKLERVSSSRWVKLGRMLGLRIESAGDPDPAARGRKREEAQGKAD